MSERHRTPPRTAIIIAATFVWLASSALPVFFHRVPSEPGIGTAYLAFLAATLGFPEIDRRRRGKRSNDDDGKGSDDD